MLIAMNHPLSQIEIMHQLREVGFTQEQAETQARIITEVNENSLATKKDVQGLEIKTDSEFVSVRHEISDLGKEMRNEFAAVRQEMRAEFALVRKEMETLKLDLTVRMTVIMGSLLSLFGAVQKFLM